MNIDLANIDLGPEIPSLRISIFSMFSLVDTSLILKASGSIVVLRPTEK